MHLEELLAPERASALLELATSDADADELVRQLLKTALHHLPLMAAGLYERSDGTWSLTGGEGRPLPLEHHGPTAHDVPVHLDGGRALLHLQGDELDESDQLFARRLADVGGTTLRRRRRIEALERSERHLIAAQRISHVGSYDFEIATNTNTWSDELYRIYGREPQSFNASYEKFMEMLHPADREHVVSVHQHALATLEPYEMEERVVWPDGTVRTLASWGEVVTDAEGRPTRMVGICWDVTDRRAMEAQLVQQALHDHLTGLPNRALLVDRLTQALAGLHRHDGTVAVLFVDVDRFKNINDSLGHEAGDDVLLGLSRRLVTAVRPDDTVARFGGDEFVVLCPAVGGLDEAVEVAERLQEVVGEPISLRGTEVVVSVSIGISTGSSAQVAAGTLLRDADAAMYRAKRDGRARTVVFAESMRAEAVGRLDTEMELRRALALDQLQVHYQPQTDLRTGRVVGVEALVRWEHPTRGFVPPSEFIAIAEETGLVVPLGEWVLEQACLQLRAWQTEHPHRSDLVMAVNLSGLQLAQPDLIGRVAGVLERTGVQPASLELEITEGVLMHDAEDTLGVLRELKRLGVRLAADDFGTGYSSLAYLKQFPVDVLKIDRTFVDGLGTDPDDSAIVEAVLALARALGLASVAEGIETTTQLEALLDLGCEKAQGFLLSPPRPPADLADLLRAGTVPLPRAAEHAARRP